MKTLLQAAIEFEVSRGGRSMGNWSETEGAPYLVTNSRDAFMAGAAAMAELFAQGQALKIEQAPRKYYIEIAAQRPEGTRYKYMLVSYLIQSYDMEEATQIAKERYKYARGEEYQTIARRRPALDTDIEGEKEIV